jgi:hypothetical protein
MKITHYQIEGSICRFIYLDHLNASHIAVATNVSGLIDYLTFSGATRVEITESIWTILSKLS